MHRHIMPGMHFSSPIAHCCSLLRIAKAQKLQSCWLQWFQRIGLSFRCGEVSYGQKWEEQRVCMQHHSLTDEKGKTHRPLTIWHVNICGHPCLYCNAQYCRKYALPTNLLFINNLFMQLFLHIVCSLPNI
jgi:hypothetical protein